MSEPVALDIARIYEAYHARVLAYATKLIGRDDAEDVAQEVFIKVGRSLDTLADRAKLSAWIYAITLNTVRDAVRKQTSRGEPPRRSPDAARAEGEGDPALLRIADSVSRTPEENAIRNEMVACYLDYLNQLPRAYYEVYVLSEFEHLSSQEIAARMSLSVGAVKIRLHRARTRLNEELRRNCRCYTNERGELMGEPKDP